MFHFKGEMLSGKNNTCHFFSPQHRMATYFEFFISIDKDLSKLFDKCPDLRKQHLFICNISQCEMILFLMGRLYGRRRRQLPLNSE